MHASHRPAVAVTGPYGHPYHPILVTVPIGAWVCTVAFDVASKLSDGRAYARAAVWLCAIGIVAAVVAAIVGFLDARRLTPDTLAHRTMLNHRNLMVVVLLLFVASFVLRRSGSDSLAYLVDGTPAVAMALAIVGLVLMFVGGWLGGRLVYTYGVRVADEDDQIFGHLQVEPDEPTSSVSTDPSSREPSRPAGEESTS